MRKVFLFLMILGFAFSASAADLTVEILDEEGNVQNADLTLEQDGEVIDEGTTLDTTVNDGEPYNLTQEVSGLEIKTVNLSISENLDLRPRILEKQTPKGDQFLTDLDSFYFINQSFDFEYTSINTGKETVPDRIAKCSEFSGFECNNWEINSTEDFTDNSEFMESETYTYQVETFSAYSSGNNAPLPEIENIQIFNITDEQDQRNEGQLIDEGLNKTFEINQKNSDEYRFGFNVSNRGSEDWTLTSDDALNHTGLNQSWTVEDIYYRLGGVQEGGTFESGTVEWNTGNGGTLETGESLSAEYIVNITQLSTNTYNQEFEAYSTDETSDNDSHELLVRKLGFLNPVIDRPLDDTVVQNNREFILNGTVTCEDGDCGELDLTPRRNDSSNQVAFNGEVFEVLNSDLSGCSDLTEESECRFEYGVNATGDKDTFHEIDLLTESEFANVESEDTENRLVEIRDILIIDLDWNTVDFGLLDPGEKERPAEKNTAGYNLTVEEDSNSIDNLWLKGSDLVNTEDSNYSIGIGNMSYSETNDVSQASNITEDYSLVDTDLEPGSVKTFYYWLDVPLGILRGAYTGSITFKANQTQ